MINVKDIPEMMNNDEIVIFDGTEYLFVGYNLVKQNGNIQKSIILQDLKNKNSFVYADINKVERIE